MKLRILSIGINLEHDEITFADFVSAPSFHDFDVILIDPLNVEILLFLNQMHETKDGFLILEWDSEGTNKAIRRTLNRRRRESEHFLSLGRLLVCISRQPHFAYLCTYEGEWPKPTESEKWVDTYDWFPLKYSQDSMATILSVASGKKINLSDPKHPFAPYFNAYKDKLCYEACLEQSKKPFYFEELQIIAETHGQLPVGFSFKLHGGQVVFLPPLVDPDPKKLAGVLLDCISATTGTIEETTPPSWASDYKVLLPNLPDLEGEIEKLHKKMNELHERLNTVEQQKTEQQKYLKLLYEQGKFQLEPVVRDAFSLFGFTVTDAEPSDGLLESGEGVALLEVEGKDDKAINIDKCRQLLDNVVDDEKKTQQPKKGLLVGNGFRLKDPKGRTEQFTQRAMESAAGNHFCLLTSDTLFQLVCQVLEDPDNGELKTQIRKQLLATNGLFQPKNK